MVEQNDGFRFRWHNDVKWANWESSRYWIRYRKTPRASYTRYDIMVLNVLPGAATNPSFVLEFLKYCLIKFSFKIHSCVFCTKSWNMVAFVFGVARASVSESLMCLMLIRSLEIKCGMLTWNESCLVSCYYFVRVFCSYIIWKLLAGIRVLFWYSLLHDLPNCFAGKSLILLSSFHFFFLN